HFFDNAFAGSAHGVKKHGLTPLGRQAVERFNALEAIIDLAHSSLKTFDEVLAATDRGVIVSHGGVRGTCQSPRNLSDGQLRALAKNGGLIGIGYWKGALCDVTPKAFAKAVSHAASVTGIEHVALGSDYDGATAVSFDASELAVVTQALLDEGFSETDIRAVLGGNVRRFLERWLPQ
ncbi:MAG: membrane dipeptidase, partial [Myxococcota bacterium]